MCESVLNKNGRSRRTKIVRLWWIDSYFIIEHSRISIIYNTNKRGRPPTILPVLPRHGFRPIIQSLSSNEHVYDNDITTVDCDKSNDCDDMIQPPQLDQRQPYLFNHFPPHLSFVNTDSNDSNTNLTNVEFDHSGLAFAQMPIAPANSTARDLLFTTFTEAEIDYHHFRY